MKDSGPSRVNLTWTDAQMDYLVQLLLEQSRIPGMKSGGGLKSKAYTAIEKSMIDRYGKDFTKEKIKNKLKYVKLKLNLTVMKEILNTSGLEYDPINKCIDVDPQVWSEYIEKYPNRKKYKGPKLWRYYDEFAEVYGDSHATGNQADTCKSMFLAEGIELFPTTPASQSTPFDMQPESSQSFTQMLHEDSLPIQSSMPTTPTTPTTQDPTMTTNKITSRSRKTRSTYDEEHYNLLHKIADDLKTMTRACIGVQFVTCCNILQELVDIGQIDSDAHVKSIEMLAEGTNPMIFVNLPPSQRVSWRTKMKPHQKFYVVFESRSQDIYDSWELCQPSVYRYKGAIFISFNTFEAAEFHMNEYLDMKYGKQVDRQEEEDMKFVEQSAAKKFGLLVL
ncbi:hypothetical protein EJ110_NYTH30213 [Nymphaea thermarum]|nr:hypothetical protein EJ110_NYTH30213 [Nymphaea thermarum]